VTYVELSKYYLASNYRSPRVARREEASLGRGRNLRSRRAPFTTPGPNVLGYIHGVGAAAGNSDHVEEGYKSREKYSVYATGAKNKPSEHVPNHLGDLPQATGYLRTAVA